MEKITLHFDGPISVEHQLHLRGYSTALASVQSAIDRAVIEITRGDLRKYARLREEDYFETEFLVSRSRDGGVIFDVLRETTNGVTARLIKAIQPAYESAVNEATTISSNLLNQVDSRIGALANGVQSPITETELAAQHTEADQTRKFADRSINKEFDQIFGLIRSDRYFGSTLVMDLSAPQTSYRVEVDRQIATRFHAVVSARSIGDPVQLRVTVRSMDAGRNNGKYQGKMTHVHSRIDFALHFRSAADFDLLAPYVNASNRREIEIIAAPILEYGTFDPAAGDMYFLALA